MPPVASPQRGSASAIRKKVPTPVAAPKQPIVPTKVPKEPVKEVKKTAVVKDDDGIAAAMAKMKQRKREQDELQDTLAAIAALKKKTTPAPPATAAPVGSASGTGDEAGSAIDEWLQSAVKAKWTWTDRKKKDLSAEVEVEFDAAGKLSNYRFIRHSTDARFDDSLKRALLSLEPLPTLRKYKATILFNLDDLQG
jgi:outer membrane biosynthesis protein TonB